MRCRKYLDASPGTSNGQSACRCILLVVLPQYHIIYARFDHNMLVTNVHTQLTALAITQNTCVSSCEVVLEDFTVKEVLEGSCHNFNTFFQSSKEKGRESQ